MGTYQMMVGYGRRDCSPTYSVPLAGYGNTRMRMSQGVYDPLYVTCIAFTDAAGKSLLLFTADQIRSHVVWTQRVRRRIAAETGIPEDHIMLTAIHTHSGPDIGVAIGDDEPYYNTYMDAFSGAAQDALADRRPVSAARAAKMDVEQMNYVRHYVLEDGTVIGPNFGIVGDRKVVRHTMPADTQLQTVRLQRDGARDILLVNWQAHPCMASTKTTPFGTEHRLLCGPDYVGQWRERVEQDTECLFAFFQGAAGNVTTSSRIPEERNLTTTHEYGAAMCEAVVKTLEQERSVSLGDLKTRQMTFVGENDHSEDGLVEAARKIRVLWAETNDTRACMLAAQPYGIHSAYHAGAIITRAGIEGKESMELDAFAVGDLAFVTAPYEMFCNNGQYIKEKSPYPVTFVLSCANGNFNYLASKEAFVHGCYEVDNRRFPEGTAEKAADCLVEMLKGL